MVVKLSRALLNKERTVSIGFDICFEFKAFKYIDFKEAEAWAQRTARDGLNSEQQAALAGLEADELDDEFRDRLVALAQEMLLDRLITQFCTDWSGIEAFEGEDPQASQPLPFSLANWKMVKDAMPMLVDRLLAQLQTPMNMVVLEGNGFAPSPRT